VVAGACFEDDPPSRAKFIAYSFSIPFAMAEKIDATSSSTDGPRDAAAGPKAIIKNVDMSDEMQQESVDIASAALEKYNIEKDIAAQIKKEFDRRHGPTWHVVVGKNFGSYVTHGECFL
jgi:dynein light chain LC8-type